MKALPLPLPPLNTMSFLNRRRRRTVKVTQLFLKLLLVGSNHQYQQQVCNAAWLVSSSPPSSSRLPSLRPNSQSVGAAAHLSLVSYYRHHNRKYFLRAASDNSNGDEQQQPPRRRQKQPRTKPRKQRPGKTGDKRRQQQQHRQPEKIAVIGGGIAGLSFAHRLCTAKASSSSLFEVTVFDTGRLRPGGRCSTRQPGDRSSEQQTTTYPLLDQYRIDHAAQILTVPPSTPVATSSASVSPASWCHNFAQQVEDWHERGIVTRYPANSVWTIGSDDNESKDPETKNDKAATTRIDPVDTESLYYGTKGMGSLATRAFFDDGSLFRLEQDTWISPSSGVRYLHPKDNNATDNGSAGNQRGRWKVKAGKQQWGPFDTIVIAHNGKCADRLMSRTPAKAVHSLLRVNFADRVAQQGGKKMTLNSIYSLSFALDGRDAALLSDALPPSFICGFIDNHPSLRFLTCQTRKYPPEENGDDIHVWTLFSSARFARKHKAPQEFLPEETIDTVSSLMIEALTECLGLARIPEMMENRLQLWGAAVPLNVWTASSSGAEKSDGTYSNDNGGFIYDAQYNVGVCGDWLVDPSVGGAWTSGRNLADFILEVKTGARAAASVGLEGSFRRSVGVAKMGIGALSSETSRTETAIA